jgi:hypothetical protein
MACDGVEGISGVVGDTKGAADAVGNGVDEVFAIGDWDS